MGKKLYVGNLPFNATDESIQEMFAQAGSVQSAKIITDRDTGRSKGSDLLKCPATRKPLARSRVSTASITAAGT